MEAYIHVLILACFCRINHDAAFISTRAQSDIEVYITLASSLMMAMSNSVIIL